MKQRFSGTIGEEYDLFKFARPHYDRFQNRLAKAVYSYTRGKAAKAVELGCGNGNTTQFILRMNKNMHVTAVDNEKIMIDQIVQSLHKEIKAGSVKVLNQDALEFLKKLKTESIDVVYSAFTLHNFDREYRHKLLQEIQRVLKKGGLFANADKYARMSDKNQVAALQRQIKAFDVFEKLGRPELKKKWTKHYLFDEKPEIIQRGQKQVAFLKEIGFTKVKLTCRENMEAIMLARKNVKSFHLYL